MNYFELYPGDYLRDTTELSLADHGAYIKLMMTYYSKEEALPAELPRLYQIATAITAAEKASVRKVVEMFFPVAADGLRHKNRIDEEIAKAQKRIQASKENGKKGASSHPKNTPKTNPQQPPQQGVCQGGQQTPALVKLSTRHLIKIKSFRLRRALPMPSLPIRFSVLAWSF